MGGAPIEAVRKYVSSALINDILYTDGLKTKNKRKEFTHLSRYIAIVVPFSSSHSISLSLALSLSLARSLHLVPHNYASSFIQHPLCNLFVLNGYGGFGFSSRSCIIYNRRIAPRLVEKFPRSKVGYNER